MQFGKQLCVMVLETQPTPRLRYIQFKRGKVVAQGESGIADLPGDGLVRVAFLGRSAFFDRYEVEAKSARTLPFHARRMVDGALAFNEPYRLRYLDRKQGGDRHQMDVVAVAEANVDAVMTALPLDLRPFSHVVLAESAIAACIARETSEPVCVLWQREGVLVGLAVEKGTVLVRSLDRSVGGAGEDLSERVERLHQALLGNARRVLTNRDLSLSLYLGELAQEGKQLVPGDTPSRALAKRLEQRAGVSGKDGPLVWPELFGLPHVGNTLSFTQESYQEQTRLWAVAPYIGGAVATLGAIALLIGAVQWSNQDRLAAEVQARSARLSIEYESLKPLLPSSEQLAALEQRLGVEAGLTDFRVDAFLAWVTHATPPGAIIRRLEVSEGLAVRGAQSAVVAQPVALRSTPTPTASAPATQRPALEMRLEWELTGEYPVVERLGSELVARLGDKARLFDSKLSYEAGRPAQFVTVLAPLPGAFRE
jgi:hypothetical protein